MGERNWYSRYRTARDYADSQAEKYRNGEDTDVYRGLTGPAWVAEAYTIAAENATSLMQTDGKQWQTVVDECKHLAQEYQAKADAPEMYLCQYCGQYHPISSKDWFCPLDPNKPLPPGVHFADGETWIDTTEL